MVRNSNRISGATAAEIASSVEAAIRAGELATGDPLPTVRGLAADLGVSAGTVAAAYRALRQTGLVAGSGRAGTRVRPAPPLSVRSLPPLPPGVRDLRTGGPDPALLPRLVQPPPRRRGYGEPPVDPPLRRVAARHLAREGLDTTSLTVVSGALDGVERVLGAWLRPGDRVGVEDPGYSAVLDLLPAMALDSVPMELDARGVRPEALEAALGRNVRAVVLTPRAQNPTGAAWDAERAGALSERLAGHPEVLVIEDDHAGPAAGVRLHSATARSVRWATIRSVSKWLSPDLRLAVLVGDATTVSRVEGRQALGAGWVSHLLQETAARTWTAPGTAAFLRHAAAMYRTRRRALLEALHEAGFEAWGSSGLTTWVPVRGEHEVVAALLEEGWAVSPGERFRVSAPPGVRVAISELRPEEAVPFARALARCTGRRPIRTG